MSGEIVRFEWGPFLSSCYITIMSGDEFGPTFHISGAGSDSAAHILSGLSDLEEKTDYSIDVIRPFLPPQDQIVWQDELKGDDLMGWEIRGKGPNFKAWMTFGGGGSEPKLTQEDKAERYSVLRSAIRTFYPRDA